VITTQFNGLDAAEHERLSLLMEECAEVIAIAGKIMRHGYTSTNPTVKAVDRITNRALLEKELGDVTFAIRLMVDRTDVDADLIAEHGARKSKRVWQYLHHNGPPPGRGSD
jgi:hypothetical protein